MQKLPATGKVKNIGICNVQLINLEKLLSDPTCKIVPSVNQIEVRNPNQHGCHVVAFSANITVYSCTQIIPREHHPSRFPCMTQI